MFDAVSSKICFHNLESAVLDLWEKEQTFKRSLEQRRNAAEFVFYDGPPFATGLPHYGHLLAGTIKDIVPRYQAMRGNYVERRFGWDCHGLPVEYEVEQALEISGKAEIEKLGVSVFNEKCRDIVLRYTEEWRRTVTRMGRWVDFDNDYKTMDPQYMESIWWVFRRLWDQNLIYEGRKILPYCPRCATPLSNFETNQGYAEVTDPAITVRFKLVAEVDSWILAWTTTPWTLPSNLALAVGADVKYIKVKDGDAFYYLAENRLEACFGKDSSVEILERLSGNDLAGKVYEPLFPYFANMHGEGAFRVHTAEFVSTDDGTGVVHIAPGFGEDDYELGRRAGLTAVCPVDSECRFTDEVSDFAGRPVKECDKDIIRRLKDEGKLVHHGQLVHSYPHCWRCDAPLIYRGISTWFMRVEEIKERLVAANREVHWVPGHLRDGRFGNWLEGARDWAISRNRYWGCPLPVWRSDDGQETVCIGSIAELEELCGKPVGDLHKHFVDEIELPSKQGRGPLKRIPEVLDCWFESGAMPYAQAHYPFENKEHFEAHFPADFIAEGLDQTRGWFYTLMVLSVALFDRPAFRNVVVNGLVLAADGKKMSKRLKNYPDPGYMIDQYGADALRLYMIHSSVVRAEDLRFSEDGVKQLVRHILIPLWNAYSFLVTYARIDGWQPSNEREPSESSLDRWITSCLESLISDVREAMDDYDLQKAIRPFVGFIDDLTNWYIRRSRRRFWKTQDDNDKQQAYFTLWYVLLQLSKVAAPFVPFISETIYRNLRTDQMPESVHLCDFPEPASGVRDELLEAQMQQVMLVVKMARQLRADHNLKVRQPLSTLSIVSRDDLVLDSIKTFEEIIREEVNIKEVKFGTHECALAHLNARPDFKRLGPRFGGDMRMAAAAIREWDESTVEEVLEGSPVELEINGRREMISAEDIVVERVPREGLVVAAADNIVTGIDTRLSSELRAEGLAREFVSRIQSLRKEMAFEVSDRIRILYVCGSELEAALVDYNGYIAGETLAVEINAVEQPLASGIEIDVNGHACVVELSPCR